MGTILFFLVAGCMSGPSDETLVDDVRVLALVAQPPEASPGEAVQVGIHVADPAGAGVEILAWSCTNLGTGCLEDPSTQASTPVWTDGQATFTATVPVDLAAVASEEPVPITALWTLACTPGLCPQVGDPAGWDLADPTAWLVDLPMEGVSLAYRTLAVSTRTDRPGNPVLEYQGPDPISAAAGEAVDLELAVTLDVPATADTLAFGFATAGGFGDTEYAVGDDGQVTLQWYAPDPVEPATLYVVVQDGAGGVAVWTGEVPATG